MTTRAIVNYAERETHDGKKHWAEGGTSTPRKNYEEIGHEVQVRDIRTLEKPPTVDQNGFALIRSPTAEVAFRDEASITGAYYDEIVELLKRETGASEVFLFDHTVRRPNSTRGPIARVHVDQTTKAAIKRVHKHMGSRAAELLTKRFQIINVWRPISHTAERDPLALCDYASVQAGDMKETDRIVFGTNEAPGETYSVAHNALHEWFYASDMNIDEAILIKCFDSKDSVARFTPHTAIALRQARQDAPPRESIEVRALLFYN